MSTLPPATQSPSAGLPTTKTLIVFGESDPLQTNDPLKGGTGHRKVYVPCPDLEDFQSYHQKALWTLGSQTMPGDVSH